MNAKRNLCTGCGSAELSAPCLLPGEPVVLNYRFPSAEAARSVPRRDIALVQCLHCGLVFNQDFEPDAVPYDENYENRQCFSPAFQAHLAALAADLISRHPMQGGRILEVGCGKGDFLRLLCEKAGASGRGYDTSYEGPEGGGTVQFYRRYVTAADVREQFHLVVCRHVVEHVPEIGKFLRSLRDIATAAGNAVTVVETPRLEWIIENGSFWDLFYEHCNYFSMPALARLARLAGFRVLRQQAVFGGQYQWIELVPDTVPRVDPEKALVPDELGQLARLLDEGRSALEEKLRRAGIERGWAIWGAGAKGVALVNRLRLPPPCCVIDSNPAKSGCVIPGSDVPVLSAADPRVLEIPVILVANPQYLTEIKTSLVSRGFRHTLLAT